MFLFALNEDVYEPANGILLAGSLVAVVFDEFAHGIPMVLIGKPRGICQAHDPKLRSSLPLQRLGSRESNDSEEKPRPRFKLARSRSLPLESIDEDEEVGGSRRVQKGPEFPSSLDGFCEWENPEMDDD